MDKETAQVSQVSTREPGRELRPLAVIAMLAMVACTSTPPRPAGASSTAVADVTGGWTMTVESPMGTRDANAEFNQAGEQLSGKVVSQRGEVPMSGTIKDGEVAFGSSVNMQGESLQIAYTGKVAGDAMAGTVRFGDFGSGKWTAKRKAP